MDRTITNRDTRTVSMTKVVGLRAITSVRVTVRALRMISKASLMTSEVPVTISRIVAMTSRGPVRSRGIPVADGLVLRRRADEAPVASAAVVRIRPARTAIRVPVE